MAMAIGLDPHFLYKEDPAVVGLGLFFKPDYIRTLAFKDASELIRSWLPDSTKCLMNVCFLFISVSL